MSVRIAIVGMGPKGLFALERVLHHARRTTTAVQVDVYEPHPFPGAGPVYDPRQPAYLRMNFPSQRIDLWPAGSLAVPAGQQRSFSDQGHRAPETYAPRAEVGRYLADGYALLAASAPAIVRLLPRHVATLTPDDGRWSVDGGAERYDEVVLATGHRAAPAVTRRPHAAALVPAVFPVDERLRSVAPGARVAVRGFALTALDACLALTEGRGGSFTPVAGDRWTYERSGAEPGRILPFSRTGRPMHAKPDLDLFADHRGLLRATREGTQRLLDLPEGFTIGGDLVAVLADTAGRGLRAVGGGGDPAGLLHDLLAPRGAGPVLPDARGELEASLLVGTGRSAPDAAWALGHTWRALYPAIVARCGGHGLADDRWPAFRRLAQELERIAFGPPPVSVAKLLALADAGIVDLGRTSGGGLSEDGGRTVLTGPTGRHEVDVVVDAVLPGPGARPGDDGVVGGLLAAGHARLRAGRRGIEVLEDGTLVGADGRAVQGLAAVGRPTEDWVVGNDTLSRTLHPQIDRWAARVATPVARRRAVAA